MKSWTETRELLIAAGMDADSLPEMWKWYINLRHADLSGADLSDANLSDANLRGANLSDADLRGTDLSDANLRGANLSDADLRGTDLSGANLSDANLCVANLRGTDLSGADLSGTDLRGADLSGADLRGADLSGADLSDADLSGADLRGADLRGADLSDADLRDANLRGAKHAIYVPAIPHIDAAILARIESGKYHLNMAQWHTCATTHCRAGHAINLAGEAGRILESIYGPNVAGALIYAASRPNMPIPNWLAGDEDALADMRRCAEADPLNAVVEEVTVEEIELLF